MKERFLEALKSLCKIDVIVIASETITGKHSDGCELMAKCFLVNFKGERVLLGLMAISDYCGDSNVILFVGRKDGVMLHTQIDDTQLLEHPDNTCRVASNLIELSINDGKNSQDFNKFLDEVKSFVLEK